MRPRKRILNEGCLRASAIEIDVSVTCATARKIWEKSTHQDRKQRRAKRDGKIYAPRQETASREARWKNYAPRQKTASREARRHLRTKTGNGGGSIFVVTQVT